MFWSCLLLRPHNCRWSTGIRVSICLSVHTQIPSSPGIAKLLELLMNSNYACMVPKCVGSKVKWTQQNECVLYKLAPHNIRWLASYHGQYLWRHLWRAIFIWLVCIELMVACELSPLTSATRETQRLASINTHQFTSGCWLNIYHSYHLRRWVGIKMERFTLLLQVPTAPTLPHLEWHVYSGLCTMLVVRNHE